MVIGLLGCGASSSTSDSWSLDELVDGDDGEAEGTVGGTNVDRVALTTEIDPITFGPVGPPAEVFPISTERIFLSFRIQGVRPGSELAVRWLRRGDDVPLSETTQLLDGDQRLAAEHVAEQPFAPGEHLVRLELDGAALLEVPFEIEGPPPAGDDAADAATEPTEARENRARVDLLSFFAGMDRRGRVEGRPLTRFPETATRIHAAFRVSTAPAGTDVAVRWTLGGGLIETTEVGRMSGRRVMTATFEPGGPLESGEYRAEVLVEGEPRASETFTVEGSNRGAAGVGGLVLASAIDGRTHRPSSGATTRFHGDEETIYLCLSYQGMRRGEEVQVRWFQQVVPDEPMAVSTVQINHAEGNLAASFHPDGALPAGEYRAEVHLRGRQAGAVTFSVGP